MPSPESRDGIRAQPATLRPRSLAGGLGRALRGGRGLPALLGEWLRLRLGPNRVTLGEYLDYGLDGDDPDPHHKSAFVGRQRWMEIERACVPARWRYALDDKLILYGHLAANGLPAPRVIAALEPATTFGPHASLRDSREAAAWLHERAPYPLVALPIRAADRGWTGRDRHGPGRRAVLLGVDRFDATLVLASGGSGVPGAGRPRRGNGVEAATRVPLDTFAQSLGAAGSDGCLFLELLDPHPATTRLCGPAALEIHVLAVVQDGDVDLLGAWTLLPAKPAPDGRACHEHRLVGIDPRSGAVAGAPARTPVVRAERGDRARAGAPAAGDDGAVLACWQSVADTCRRCAASLPAMAIQTWTLAITSRGPVVTEARGGGDPYPVQLALGRGLLTPAVRRRLERLGAV